VKTSKLAPRYLFIAPPDMDALEDRLRERGTENEQDVQKRLGNAAKEIEYGKGEGNFDMVLVNEVLEDSFAQLTKLAENVWYPHLKEEREAAEAEERKEGEGEDGSEGGESKE